MMRSISLPGRISILLDRGPLRQLGMPILVASAVLLVSAVLLLGVNVSMLRHSFEWVQKADDILLKVLSIENSVIQHELTVRGYALTNDPAFLRYEANETATIAAGMRDLQVLVSGDPAQAKAFRELQRSVDRHTAVFRRLAGLGPGHAADVARAIRDPQKRRVMAAARSALEDFRNAELRILAQREALVAQKASRTYALAVGIVAAAFSLGAIGLLIYRH